MDRRNFLKQAGLAGLAAPLPAALAAPALAADQPVIRWKLASSFPKTLDTIFGGAEDIAAHVAASTDGRFTIEVHEPGVLVGGLETVPAVSAGTIDMTHTSAYYFTDKDPTFAIGTALPFGLNARQQNAWFFQGNGNRLMNDFFATQGLYGLPAGNTGVQMGGWFRKEVNTVDDLKGLKMRIAGLAGRILEKLGAAPQQLAGGDITPALEAGTIDAAEWVGPYDDQKLGLQKVAKYYYYPGWWEGGPVIHALVNLTRWNSLPKAYQAALTDACHFANTNMLAKYDARNPAALKTLVADGAQLRPFSQDILEACYRTALSVYDEISAANPTFKAIYEDQLAFKRDAYLWAQIADYSFDTFMMIQQRAGRL